MMIKTNLNSGFTLLELLVSIVIAGILGGVAASNLSLFTTSSELVRYERAKEDNRLAGIALLEHASVNNNGRLVTPYVGAGYRNAVTDPNNTNVTNALRSNGLNVNTFNSDGTAGERLRIYQRITTYTSIPFFGNVGESVNINYDTGVIYQTNCQKADTTCNTNSGVPSESVTLTSANLSTWNVSGDDINPYFFSTYGLQQSKIRESASRLIVIRDALRNLFMSARLSAAPGDTTNFYPTPTGIGAPNLSGGNVALNEGCRDGWYSLSSNSVNILSQLNLSPKNYYGITSFGGVVQYCRDFDPANIGVNTAPHGAALRINRTISDGAVPAATNNFLFSF